MDYSVCLRYEDMSWPDVPQVMAEWRRTCFDSDKQSGAKYFVNKGIGL
jgi:hypothetical protein